MVVYRGEKFSGYNKPKRTPGHPKKSHAVLAKSGSEVRLIRFGQQGVSGSPYKKGESDKARKRRKSFQARHASNIKKGVMSAAYWANRVKWQFMRDNPVAPQRAGSALAPPKKFTPELDLLKDIGGAVMGGIRLVNNTVRSMPRSAYNAATGRPFNPYIKQSLPERALGALDAVGWYAGAGKMASSLAAEMAAQKAAKQAAAEAAMSAETEPWIYGIHTSPLRNLDVIEAGSRNVDGGWVGDAVPGTNYAWRIIPEDVRDVANSAEGWGKQLIDHFTPRRAKNILGQDPEVTQYLVRAKPSKVNPDANWNLDWDYGYGDYEKIPEPYLRNPSIEVYGKLEPIDSTHGLPMTYDDVQKNNVTFDEYLNYSNLRKKYIEDMINKYLPKIKRNDYILRRRYNQYFKPGNMLEDLSDSDFADQYYE